MSLTFAKRSSPRTHWPFLLHPEILPMPIRMGKGSISTRFNAKQGSTSLFHLLPVEVVSEIFMHGTQLWQHQEPQSLPFPTIVAGVCRHWRTIAENTPGLWTFILPPLHKKYGECLVWISKWLARSRTKLMSVVLDIRIVGRINEERARRRLRRLDIRSGLIGDIREWMDNMLSPENLPHLEQFSLCSSPEGPLDRRSFLWPNYDWSCLKDFPTLKKLRLHNSISPPCIPTLTSLTTNGGFVNYEGIKILFSGAPHLACLVMHDFKFWEDQSLEHRTKFIPIPAPLSLCSIAVEMRYNGVIHDQEPGDRTETYSLFAYIAIPNLEYLEIRGILIMSSCLALCFPGPYMTPSRN
ncbi:hypothetical protein CPB84DRAFT_1319254 [Gymnopilus junonius]|uniref:F-box domain-containing protein n=1 Tax=Gymnopilus junonius TaxID=109634 RepID=A0A9P5NHR8_GYMJU|nr:hypothetical protein CPB84DRAFT_1319254 [Gymnopilus junonius]